MDNEPDLVGQVRQLLAEATLDPDGARAAFDVLVFRYGRAQMGMALTAAAPHEIAELASQADAREPRC